MEVTSHMHPVLFPLRWKGKRGMWSKGRASIQPYVHIQTLYIHCPARRRVPVRALCRGGARGSVLRKQLRVLAERKDLQVRGRHKVTHGHFLGFYNVDAPGWIERLMLHVPA